MITVENWAEIRRLHRSEGISQAGIARTLGISRNTVAKALASDRPPKYERAPAGSSVDEVEARVRVLLAEFPTMPATVISERIGWDRSLTILKDRIRELRPLFAGVDPTDRVEYDPARSPSAICGCRRWACRSAADSSGSAGPGDDLRILPDHRRDDDPLAQGRGHLGRDVGGDHRVGRLPRTLVWDREAAIGGTGKLTAEAAGFAGTLGVRIKLAPARDPEFKGLVERRNGFFETSFLPGRTFTSPLDFNDQMTEWLAERANSRHLRSIGGRRSTGGLRTGPRWSRCRSSRRRSG